MIIEKENFGFVADRKKNLLSYIVKVPSKVQLKQSSFFVLDMQVDLLQALYPVNKPTCDCNLSEFSTETVCANTNRNTKHQNHYNSRRPRRI